MPKVVKKQYVSEGGEWVEVTLAAEALPLPPEVLAGSIYQYAGLNPPAGWLLCDGTPVSVATYPDLFAVCGTTYGGDGTTTFGLPDLRGRVPVGVDATQPAFDTAGKTGGATTHTLTESEMPSHTHITALVMGWPGSGPAGAGESFSGWVGGIDPSVGGINATDPMGGGLPHDNLQPYITLIYIIKT